ncbi:hypothetical protein [Saccharopolyspora rosea]|uniref:Lipoprotein n=1 Tax=Saccharopolyspora rosea TaxID=524884 RepID=A0ABW3FSV2_9PSEU|nr:hypothetical protein [Saccharopolyspora rosea]
MRRLLLLPLLACVLAACGGDPASAVDPQVRGQLIGKVAAVRAAAQRQDRGAAESALADLTRSVAAAQSQGKMDEATARTVLAAADRVADDVRTITPPPPPAPVTITVPTPAPTEPAPDGFPWGDEWDQYRGPGNSGNHRNDGGQGDNGGGHQHGKGNHD